MEELAKYIKERIEMIDESYEYYLEKLDITFNPSERAEVYNKMRDLRIEKNVLLNVQDIAGIEEE